MIKLRHIPNIITVFRLFLIAPVAWAILQADYPMAFWLFTLAGFSDALDGFLARQFNWQSQLGATLDPIADKLLMIISFYCLYWQGIIPWWLFTVVLIRDLVIVVGASAYHFVTRSLKMEPILLGKLNTAIQIIMIMVILAHLSYQLVPINWVDLLAVLLLISTLSSGIAYVGIWLNKTRAASQ